MAFFWALSWKSWPFQIIIIIFSKGNAPYTVCISNKSSIYCTHQMNFGPDTVKNVLEASIPNNEIGSRTNAHPTIFLRKIKYRKKRAFQAIRNSHNFKVNHVYDVRVYECMKNYLTNRDVSIIWQSNRSNLDSMTIMSMMMMMPNHYTFTLFFSTSIHTHINGFHSILC